MSTYYWDIGFDLNENILKCQLVEVYFQSSSSSRLAVLTMNPVFYPGDQINFNVFNISSSTIDVEKIEGSIKFADGKCPFNNTTSPIPITGGQSMETGQSEAFNGSYPRWPQKTFVISNNLVTYSFTVNLTVTPVKGAAIVLPPVPDPEMIVGSAG